MEKGDRYQISENLVADYSKLPDDRKTILLEQLIVNHYGLTETEFTALRLPYDQLTSSHPDNILHYSRAEGKIENSRNGISTDGVNSEDPEEAEARFNAVKSALKSGAMEATDSSRYDDYIDSLVPMDGSYFIYKIGRSHPLWRRVRNAYLPGMTSLITIHQDDQGNFLKATDETSSLFNGPDDAVSQIEKLLG